jgi:hypothetical protein
MLLGMDSAAAFVFLTEWFMAQCNGDWEHDEGIRIETLDNPGWALDVRIANTELEGSVTDWHRDETSEHVWVHWRSTGQAFEARCGPKDLARALAAFQAFATSQSSP